MCDAPRRFNLLDETLPQSKVIGLMAQRDEQKEEPGPQDIYKVGTAALVLKLFRQTDDHVIVLIQGLRRFGLRKITSTDPFIRAEIEVLASSKPEPSKEWEALFRNLRDSAARLLEAMPDVPEQARTAVRAIDDPEQLVDFLAPNLNIDVAQKQAILEELDFEKRLRAVQTQYFVAARDRADPASCRTGRAVAVFRRATPRLFARATQGDSDASSAKARPARMNRSRNCAPDSRKRSRRPKCMAQADRELKRLDFIPPASPEYSVIVSYVETIAELPWSKLSEDNLDLEQGAGDSRSRSLRPRKGEAAADRISRRAQTESAGARPDPLFPRAARRRQNQPWSIDRRRARAQILAHESRRNSRRSGDSRTSPHLHRFDARPHHPGVAPRRDAQSGHDAGRDRQGRARIFAAIRPARCSKCSIRGRTMPLSIAISMCHSICRKSFSLPRPITSKVFRNRLRDRMETISLPGYTEREKLEIAQTLSRSATTGRERTETGAMRMGRGCARLCHHRLHARSRGARTRATDRRRSFAARRSRGRARGSANTSTVTHGVC